MEYKDLQRLEALRVKNKMQTHWRAQCLENGHVAFGKRWLCPSRFRVWWHGHPFHPGGHQFESDKSTQCTFAVLTQ